jgi:uncharacterized protein
MRRPGASLGRASSLFADAIEQKQLTQKTGSSIMLNGSAVAVQAQMGEVKAGLAYLSTDRPSVIVAELTEAERAEVLAFLAERPVHTVIMAGLIRDNGIVSAHHRGTFWGCRNAAGRLEGVALIGHATLIEARTERALREFAWAAQTCSKLHMIMGECERVEEFWRSYADNGQPMRLACRELLFELRQPLAGREEVAGLRLATPADLDLIPPVQAQLAAAESGINPLDIDPVGFRQRCLRRIEQGRVSVLIEDGRLLFKSDVQAETPEVVYLEGVYVNPGTRGTGLGRRCFTQLSQQLLTRTKCVCLLVNEKNERAQAFYRKGGYKLTNVYDTIFVA